jgi:hypothetical protein
MTVQSKLQKRKWTGQMLRKTEKELGENDIPGCFHSRKDFGESSRQMLATKSAGTGS